MRHETAFENKPPRVQAWVGLARRTEVPRCEYFEYPIVGGLARRTEVPRGEYFEYPEDKPRARRPWGGCVGRTACDTRGRAAADRLYPTLAVRARRAAREYSEYRCEYSEYPGVSTSSTPETAVAVRARRCSCA